MTPDDIITKHVGQLGGQLAIARVQIEMLTAQVAELQAHIEELTAPAQVSDRG